MPPVYCNVSEMNQVFLNLLVNAAHAIGDVVKGTGKFATVSSILSLPPRKSDVELGKDWRSRAQWSSITRAI
jgi:nitrogen-specific signal transduction histidine kinase